MAWQGVEIEIQVPCAEGQTHPVRLRFTGWGEYEVAYNPCEELLGPVFARMAACTHYLHEQFPRAFREDTDLKRRLVEALRAAGAPAVPALIQALGDSYSDVRRVAAEALGAIGDPQAVPALIQALGDNDSSVRRAAAEALVKIGAPAVPALIQALGDSDSDVRRAAAWALGKLGDPHAVPALSVWVHAGEDAARNALQTLRHPALDLTQAVAQVAAQGAWGVLIRALPNEKVREAVVGLGTPAVPALIQALGDSDRNVRRAAAAALGAIGDPHAVPALIKALGDRDLYVRRAAAGALGAIGDPQAVPALIQALGDSYSDVRRVAAGALGELGDPKAVPALIKALGDWDPYVRRAAAEALGKLGDPKAVPALIKALGDSSEDVRRAAAAALVKIGTPAVPALIKALGDSDRDVRRAVAEALGAISDPQAVPALIQALGDSYSDVRRAAAAALGKLGDPQAVPALSVWVHAGEDAARNALQTLGRPALDLTQAVAQVAAQGAWGVLIRALPNEKVREAVVGLGTPTVPALIQALEDSDGGVRRAAAEALGKLGDSQAVPALSVCAHAGEESARKALQTLGHPAPDLPQAVAQLAAKGAWGVLIRALPNEKVREIVMGFGVSAVPALIQALGSRSDRVRRVACEALGAIGDPQAVPALSVCAHAGEESARKALQTLGHPAPDLPQAVAQLAAKGAWGVLIRALPNEKVREAVVGLGTPAVPALIQALRDWDRGVRWAAAEALVKIGTPAVPALIQALGSRSDRVRRAAAAALGKLGDPQAVPALSVWAHAGENAARKALQTLGHPALDLPQAVSQVAAQGVWGVLIRALPNTKVCRVIVQLGTPAVPKLTQAIGDSDGDVRRAGCEVLGAIGDPEAVPALIQALRDSNAVVRESAGWGLGAIGDPQAVSALIKALGDKNENVRGAAAWALGAIGDPQAVPALTERLQDESGYVRKAAQDAIQQIRAKQSGKG